MRSGLDLISHVLLGDAVPTDGLRRLRALGPSSVGGSKCPKGGGGLLHQV